MLCIDHIDYYYSFPLTLSFLPTIKKCKQFAVIMFIILVAEIALGVYVGVSKDGLKGTLKNGFDHALKKYEGNKDAWNFVQKEVRRNCRYFNKIH